MASQSNGGCGALQVPLTVAEYQARLTTFRDTAYGTSCTVHGDPIDAVMDRPLVSIVTPCLNSVKTLERTIASILAQEFQDIEYIVIDGGSDDGTLEIIRKYDPLISYWHTGKDRGISDAFNLGIAASRGKYVALVNADDWMSPGQVHAAVSALEANSAAAFAFGRLVFHDAAGRFLYSMDGDAQYYENIRVRMPQINHVSVVARRSAYESVGLFDLRRRIAMDYDWHLRAELRGLRGIYEPTLIANMSEGGVCFRNWKGGLREVRDCALEHGQDRWGVEFQYRWRLTRGILREFAGQVLPSRAVEAAHKLLNPQYRSTR